MEKKTFNVCFLQGNEAREGLEILLNRGDLEALLYLKERDYKGLNDEDIPFYRDSDTTINYSNYIMYYNLTEGYLGLVRIENPDNRYFDILSKIKNFLINLFT